METAQEFCKFLDDCPIPYFFNKYARQVLTESGFKEMDEGTWDSIPKKGFVIRDERALVAFKVGGTDSFIAVGTHNDSPCLKTKPFSELPDKANLSSIHVSVYGGLTDFTWFDRDLRTAGLVYIKNEDGSLSNKLFDSREAIATIPSTEQPAGKNPVINSEEDLQPYFGTGKVASFKTYLSKKLEVNEESIVGWDLSFVDAQPSAIIGTKKEFIAGPRIDNLGSTFSALKAFLASEPKGTINLLVVYDNEEIGSNTLCGAQGNFLSVVLHHLIPEDKYLSVMSKSYFISSDNAHAIHPNYPERHEALHQVKLGQGVVIKKSAFGNYGTDQLSTIPMKLAAEKIGAPLQYITTRNDRAGGGTIGKYIGKQIGVCTIDIGQPQLAMHSIRELISIKDITDLTVLLKELYDNYLDYQVKV